MRALRRWLCAAGVGLVAVTAATAAHVSAALAAGGTAAESALASAPAAEERAAPAAAARPPATRVEAQSADFLAVGLVQGDRMSIRLSRVADNAPVPDAVLTVLLRGVVHPTVAEADGSYTLKTQDLTIPGDAAMEFQLARGAVHERLPAAIQVAQSQPKPADENSVRQLGWWVLNFAVCIGFLMLLSRRRKTAAEREAASKD